MNSQKRLAFRSSTVSFPTEIDAGSCQAARIEAAMSKPVLRVAVTPEWLAENAVKQLAYEEKFRAWRKLHPSRNTTQ
ncbi:MAG TPA: hypothetical protein VHW09_26920 [Bryobacteraceae bacterium]|jgi:hypothetical protein|nr:hypothetical protein [Bryobacteraceae bacterium]